MGLFSNINFLKRQKPEPTVEEPTPAAQAPAPPTEPASAAEPVATAVVAPAAPAPVAAAPAPDSQTRAQAEALVASVVQELPDYITVAVVASETGQILAGRWAGHSGGAVEVAAANAEIVRQTRLAITALQLEATEELEDIVVTLRRQLHLIQLVPRQQWLLYLAIPTQNTNLALARTVLRMQAA